MLIYHSVWFVRNYTSSLSFGNRVARFKRHGVGIVPGSAAAGDMLFSLQGTTWIFRPLPDDGVDRDLGLAQIFTDDYLSKAAQPQRRRSSITIPPSPNSISERSSDLDYSSALEEPFTQNTLQVSFIGECLVDEFFHHGFGMYRVGDANHWSAKSFLVIH